MRVNRLPVLALLAALALNGHAELRLVTGNNYPPFADQSLPQGGLSVALVRAAFAATGEATDLDYLPWVRGYRDLLEGDYDASFPYVRTPDRADQVRFSQPMMTVDTLVISSARQPVAYTGPDSLSGKRLCQAQGWGIAPDLATPIRTGRIAVSKVSTYPSCFRMLLAGRVDFLLSNEHQWAVLARMHDLDPDDFHVADTPVQRSQHHLIAPRNAAGAEVIERFNRGLRALRESGDHQRLIADYLEAF